MRRMLVNIFFTSLVATFLLPQVFIVRQALSDERPALWSQSPDLVLGLVTTTLGVASLAIAIALLIGLTAASVVTRMDVPGRQWWSVGLCLPFAIPSYLYAGVMKALDDQPWAWFPDRAWGVGLALGLTLYPWVYLPAKVVMAQQSRAYSEAAVSLGLTAWQRWWRVHFPLLLPTIAACTLLMLMAVLSDFGTAAHMGVKTLSVGIHDAMFSMYRRDWAAQLALLGLAVPLLAVVLLAWCLTSVRTYNPTNISGPVALWRPPTWLRWVVVTGLTVVMAIAFGVPVLWLLWAAIASLDNLLLNELPAQAWDTVLVTVLVTAVTVLGALAIQLLTRRDRELRWWRHGSLVVNLNYAIPGIMLGIAFLFASKDMPTAFSEAVLSNSVMLLVMAASLGLICFPFVAVQAGLRSIDRDVDDLCATVGMTGMRRLITVDVPMLRRALACGALLVMVNMAKELPISEVLHPFGFRSLSLRLHGFLGVGVVKDSAVFALLLIALLIYPVMVLDRLLMKGLHART